MASRSVPLYRRIRSIDTPLAERYLFVIAHPRSGSTVLSHVLQSHEDIIGFGEHHESYTSSADLSALAARNAFFDRAPTAERRYTLDKIVSNDHEISNVVLSRSDTRIIFLVREPIATLESYRRLLHYLTTDEERLESYRTRIDGMVALAEATGDADRMMFVDYKDLTSDTDATLARLTTWLELDTPLTPEYDLNAKSGRRTWGDPSEHIKAKTIISVTHDPAELDGDVIEAAHEVYATGAAKLKALDSQPVTSADQAPVAEPR